MTRVNGREAPKTHGSNGQFDADELAAYGIAPTPRPNTAANGSRRWLN